MLCYALQDLAAVLGVDAKSGAAVSGGGGGSSGGGGVCNHPEVTRLSNKFYTLIPHVIGRQKDAMSNMAINTAQKLKDKLELVDALGNIEVATQLLSAAGAAADTHPVDARYAQMRTRLTPVDTSSELHALLSQYLPGSF